MAAGLAARTGLDVNLVRTGFVVAALFSLFGAAAYVVAWLLIPAGGRGRQHRCPLEQAFRRRALGAGAVAGAVALGGIVVVNSDYHRLFHALLTGDALAAVIVSFLAGVTTLALVWRRRFDTARFGAAVAVASIIAGWAFARWPTILPGLTIDNGAAGHDTLVWIVVAVAQGGAITFPSRRLASCSASRSPASASKAVQRGLPSGGSRHVYRSGAAGPRGRRAPASSPELGLPTLLEAAWQHAIGVVCLFGFVIAAFLAIVPPALADQAEDVPAGAKRHFFPS